MSDRLELIEARWREAGCGDADKAWLIEEVKRLQVTMRKLAAFIVAREPHYGYALDHACAECVPGGEMVQPDLRCGFHEATAVLASPPRTTQEAVAFPCCGGVDAHSVSCSRARP